MNTGLYPNMARADYESQDAVNYSKLKLFERSPAHARAAMLHPAAPSAAMDFGSALHCALLEPTRFAESYAVAPKVDRRTTAGKSAWADFEANNHGREIVSADDMQAIHGMAAAVAGHPIAKELLAAEGAAEVGVFWKDADTGLDCKALIDRLTKFAGWSVVLDIKTTEDARAFHFAGQVARYEWHMQAAFYLDGLATVAPFERRFWHIAIEKSEPFGVIVYELQDEDIARGRTLYRRRMEQFKECQEKNLWPGYSDGLEPLNLPKWAS